MAFAVFFGFVFIGLVYLYTKTKDTWNWKKISLWFGGSVAALVIISLVAIFADSFKSLTPTISTTLTSYDDISLGEKFSDVEFKKGKLIKTSNSKVGDDSYYKINDKTSVFIDNASQTVSGILANCGDYQSVTFNGISCGSSGDLIQDKFKGEITVMCPSWEGMEDKDPIRGYDVPKYGVRYALQKNQVIGMFIFPKSFWADKKSAWTKCK